MSRAASILATLLLLILSWPGAPPQGPQAEPPDRFFLTVDGDRVELALDQPATLRVGGVEASVKLSVQPTRVFETDAFVFEYPRHLVFAHDLEPPESWDLDGSDVALMLQRHDLRGGGTDELLQSIADAITQGYGEGLQREEPADLDLDGTRYRGRRILAKLAGSVIQQELFVVPGKSGEGWLLILQDLPEDGGTDSEEMRSVRAALARTFRHK